MSLTSYRAAPPRVFQVSGVRYQAPGEERRGSVLFLIPGAWFLEPVFGGPGGDLLSRVLGRSTIGAEGFHGRVRDGIGCLAPRHDHQVVGRQKRPEGQKPEKGETRARELFEAEPSGFLAFWFLASERRAQGLQGSKPNERLVPVSFTHCCASTPGLST